MNSPLTASVRRTAAALLCLPVLAFPTYGQSTTNNQSPDAPSVRASLEGLPRNVLHDQEAIWTSPIRLRAKDLTWFLPLAAATGVAIATDRQASRDVVSHDADFNNASVNASNVLVGGLLISPAVFFGVGHFRGDSHAQETGLLGAEALADGVVVEQGMKFIFWRERPYMDDGRGKFFQTSVGSDSSFPSSHSVLAWSTAAVIAGEYPNRWTELGVYGAATGISLTRVMGQQHFPSDVLVGSATGWLIGHYVYRHGRRKGLRD